MQPPCSTIRREAVTNAPWPPPAAVRAIALIKGEHRQIAHMLSAMQALVARYRDARGERDFELLEAMLLYLEKVPDQVHHPKEDAVLFPALARHASAGKRLVDELELEHACGRPLLTAVCGALHAFRDGAVNGLDRLILGVDEFAEFYGNHMRKEEEQLLPLAVAHLAAGDWERVADAFGDNADPRPGAALAGDYHRLYQCIAELMPPSLRSYLGGAAPDSSEKEGTGTATPEEWRDRPGSMK